MKTKIIVLTTDGDSREDGNVYYSGYIIVQSAVLNFDEPIFKDVFPGSFDGLTAALQDLGYTVTTPENEIIACEDAD